MIPMLFFYTALAGSETAQPLDGQFGADDAD
jgi:hypothetical protein